jgi:hypothetical protein
MKKLHLIKPWRMRVVRQNLSELRMYGVEETIFVPCQGPSGAQWVSNFLQDSPRAIGSTNIRSISNNAPLSGAIFVQDNPRTR